MQIFLIFTTKVSHLASFLKVRFFGTRKWPIIFLIFGCVCLPTEIFTGGEGVILKIFGGGVPPVSPNPDPISEQTM